MKSARLLFVLLASLAFGCDDAASSGDAAALDGGACTPSSPGYAQYFEDRDGDGVGTTETSLATCSGAPPFASWVAEDGDCDDADENRRPGLPESCNGEDDDCDEVIDNGLTFVDYHLDGDGDGVGAGAPVPACASPGEDWVARGGDCDDEDPQVNPDAVERCNGYDDDCAGGTDDGDPTALCEGSGGICELGRCSCEPIPPIGVGASCEEAIDLGVVYETGQAVTSSVNVSPVTRTVWYRFRARETSAGIEATSCDEFHVRALFLDDPDERFALRVRRGDCGRPYSPNGFSEFVTERSYAFATDLRVMRSGALIGQCPCTDSGSPPPDIARCIDDSQDFFVEVRRLDPADLTCVSSTLEVSNGVYSADDL